MKNKPDSTFSKAANSYILFNLLLIIKALYNIKIYTLPRFIPRIIRKYNDVLIRPLGLAVFPLLMPFKYGKKSPGFL